MIVDDTGISREVGIVPNLRHKRELEQCLVSCKRARRGMINALPAEMIATDIISAIDGLDRLLGERCGPDILDQVFSRFCIGK